jgi:hypothetical protein
MNWPLSEASFLDQKGITSGAVGGTVVTAGAVNTKGAYAQLVAATTYAAEGIMVVATTKGTADYLIDIAIGAAASEQVVVPNIAASGATYLSRVYFFPVKIPAGVRVAARSQASTASAAISVHIGLVSSGFLGIPGYHRVEALGANTTDSGGGALTAPGVINTMSAWAQIGGATAFPYKWIVPSIGDQAITARTSGQRYMFEVGIGAGGAQSLLIPGIPAGTSSTSFADSGRCGFPINVPAGSSLWGRYSSSALTTLGADLILYGCG